MARLVVDGDDVVVRLTPRERLLALRRDVRVPAAAITQVRIEPDWWRALRGTRRSGLYVPDRYCAGERQHPGGVDFAAVREGGPVVVVELRPSAPYARLAVSVADPERTVEEIRRR
ncbi:hypothetical protein [Streptomyces sp. HUAS ZL42]|uniref:hypothetical protein n=1 Tax=Streptomyces sp. HUAS ZL42 TaxID=3231715 RepID=UPI00345F05DB